MILTGIKNASTPHTQQNQQITPCTHAYHHITHHINNLEDSMQQNILYTMEEDASVFIGDTTTLCEYNIAKLAQNSKNNFDDELKSKTPIRIHSQSKHKYRNIVDNSNIQ